MYRIPCDLYLVKSYSGDLAQIAVFTCLDSAKSFQEELENAILYQATQETEEGQVIWEKLKD